MEWKLGKQNAATSLGSAVGSAAGGFFFDSPFDGASFVLVAALTSIGLGLSLGLPRLLVPRRLGDAATIQAFRSPFRADPIRAAQWKIGHADQRS
ncbi:MAG: hypothetical protein M3T55_00855 [Pseudomonadota bacterium]|nr:hypothetical protein [Pseudomonadota bacterium]